MGEVYNIRTKSLGMRGVGEIYKLHTKSLWVVWETYTKIHTKSL